MSPLVGRPQPQQRFFLVLEGAPCGFLRSAAGGWATADVVPQARPGDFVPKHLGPARYEPISISFGLDLAPPVYEWIRAAWNGKLERRKGSIVAVGVAGTASALEFHEAVVVETTLPRLDAAAKDQAAIELTFAPALTKQAKSSAPAGPADSKQKPWLASNFKVEIAGLDCTRVSKVEALTVPASAPVDFPALRMTFAASSLKPWRTGTKSSSSRA